MRRFLAVGIVLLASAGIASAQGLEYKPIDTSKYVVQPADTATNIFSSASRYVSRVVANTIDSNGYVKTLNSLLGRSETSKATNQAGYSPLPLPSMYPSSSYKNSFTPQMPRYQTYGTTPK